MTVVVVVTAITGIDSVPPEVAGPDLGEFRIELHPESVFRFGIGRYSFGMWLTDTGRKLGKYFGIVHIFFIVCIFILHTIHTLPHLLSLLSLNLLNRQRLLLPPSFYLVLLALLLLSPLSETPPRDSSETPPGLL